PYAFMGASVLLIRLASVSGIVGGTVIAGLDLNPSFKTMLVFCIALYLLSIVLLFMLRIRKRSEREQRPAASGEPVRGEDAFDAKGAEVTARHGLTDRESEILLLLARGRSSTYIGEALYLSPNTVRGHIKNIYAKLGVHSKQEIIDLFTA
ncbi:MAG: helix-turn-helix transcriptional regulator, partial [Eggerthella sp.]|nr:helix-turn-helix transcriptional regulator [Eggerthella sp.]